MTRNHTVSHENHTPDVVQSLKALTWLGRVSKDRPQQPRHVKVASWESMTLFHSNKRPLPQGAHVATLRAEKTTSSRGSAGQRVAQLQKQSECQCFNMLLDDEVLMSKDGQKPLHPATY